MLKEYWIELWNPDSRTWQYIDRILFVILPSLALILFIEPNLSQGWKDIMANLMWVIPISIWVLFLLIVPYRIANKYKKQLAEIKRDKIAIPNRDRLLRTISYFKDCTLIAFVNQQVLSEKKCRDEPFCALRDSGLNDFEEACKMLSAEKLVAGEKIDGLISSLMLFALENMVVAINGKPPAPKKLTGDEFLAELHKKTEKTIRQINKLAG